MKKLGQTDTELRRRRVEIDVAIAAIKCLGCIASLPQLSSCVTGKFSILSIKCVNAYIGDKVAQWTQILESIHRLAISSSIQSSSDRDILTYISWFIANQNLPPSTLEPLLPQLLMTTTQTFKLILKDNEKSRRMTGEALYAIEKLVLTFPRKVLLDTNFEFLFSHILKSLALKELMIRRRTANCFGAIAAAVVTVAADPITTLKLQKILSILKDEWLKPLKSKSKSIEPITTLSQNVLDFLKTSKRPEESSWSLTVLGSLPIFFGKFLRGLENDFVQPITQKVFDHMKSTDDLNSRILANLAWNHYIRALLLSSPLRNESSTVEDLKSIKSKFRFVDSKGLEPLLIAIDQPGRTVENNSLPLKRAFAASTRHMVTSLLYATSGFICHDNIPIVSANYVWESVVNVLLKPMLTNSEAQDEALKVAWSCLIALTSVPNEIRVKSIRNWSADRLVSPILLQQHLADVVTLDQLNNCALQGLAEAVKPNELCPFNLPWLISNTDAVLVTLEKVIISTTTISAKESFQWDLDASGAPVIPVCLFFCFRNVG